MPMPRPVRRAALVVNAATVGAITTAVWAESRDARTTAAVGVMGLVLLAHLTARACREH